MWKTRNVAILILLLLVWSYFARPVYDFIQIALGRGRDKVAEKIAAPALAQPYDDVVALNTRLVAEMDSYIRKTRELSSRSLILTSIQFSSIATFSATTESLRAALKKAVGYPIPDAIQGNDFSTVQSHPLGDDDLATYTWLTIPALGNTETGLVHAAGILIIPKKHDAKMPLIIAAHGRGGMPGQRANGKIPILQPNHRDLAQGAIERGWAVFEPVFGFYGKGYPEDIRYRLTVRANEAGTSLIAIEFTKTIRAIDYLLTRPEFDASRLAMVGISYGGFNTLYTTALDPRIRVAVVAAYFNDRAAILADNELDFLDWRFPNSSGLLSDPNIAALVCPRPLQIQAGTQDQLFPIEGAHDTAPLAAETYRKLGLETQFSYHEFTGRHDFDGEAAWSFIEQHFAK